MPRSERRIVVYVCSFNHGRGEEPVPLHQTDSLSDALGWIDVHRDELTVRRLRLRGPSIGEVFDWRDGSTVIRWLIK